MGREADVGIKAGKLAAEKVGNCRSLPPRRIHPAACIGQEDAAQRPEKGDRLLRAETPKGAGEKGGIVGVIVFCPHVKVGDVPLPVARCGQLAAEAFSALEEGDVFSRLREADGGEKACGSPADDGNVIHAHILQQMKNFVND